MNEVYASIKFSRIECTHTNQPGYLLFEKKMKAFTVHDKFTIGMINLDLQPVVTNLIASQMTTIEVSILRTRWWHTKNQHRNAWEDILIL